MRLTGLEFDRTHFTLSQKKRFRVPESSQWGRREHLLPQCLRISTEAVNVLSRRARMLDPGKMKVFVSYHAASLLPCRWAQYLHTIQSMQPTGHPVKATLCRERTIMTYYSLQFDCRSDSLLYYMQLTFRYVIPRLNSVRELLTNTHVCFKLMVPCIIIQY